MDDTDLNDREWAAVRRLLPRCGPAGPNYRMMINGLLWQQSTGGRWHDLPSRYGPWHRCAERLRLWNIDGTWQNILTVLAACRPVPHDTHDTHDAHGDRKAGEPVDEWNTPWLR
ncbi:transposase [Streptomyces sp. NPDC058279]|uniref:transposase n=1 Tax=Streptomyces sp. NPDC058279 TaxID=3346418 RepID=UPI0036E34F85